MNRAIGWVVSVVALLLPAAAMAQGADAQASALVQQASAAADNIVATAGEMVKSGKLDQVTEQFDRLHGEVVEPLIKAGGMSCDAIAPALTVVLGVSQHMARMGVEPRASLIEAQRRLNPDGGKCEEDAKAKCQAAADPKILIRFWTSSRRAALTGTSPTDDKYDALLEKRAKRICTGKSYKITGNAGPMQVSGTACSLEEPFTVKGGGGGMTVQFSYTPGGETGGQVTYTGGGSGVKMAGAGSYTVTLDDKGGTLKQTHTGKVLITGGGSATHTDTLKLTRMEPPC